MGFVKIRFIKNMCISNKKIKSITDNIQTWVTMKIDSFA